MRLDSKPIVTLVSRGTLFALLLLALVAAGCGGAGDASGDAGEPESSEAETETSETNDDGYDVLLAGDDLSAWRGFQMESIPDGWMAHDGVLHFQRPEAEDANRADLITKAQYTDFDFRFEWAVSEGGNSGVMFHVTEGENQRTYQTGPEYQILDDDVHHDGGSELTSAASNYALHPRTGGTLAAVGEFNEGRIVVHGDQVRHYLNGEEVVAYTLWDAEWQELVKASKFDAMPGYGLSKTGHIALQDHNDEIWFRNLRIRDLSAGADASE